MTTTLTTNKIAAAVVGLALAFTFAVATPAKAQTVAELQAQIQQLLTMIASLQGGAGSTTTGGSCTGFTFTRNHTLGNSGGEVMEIQKLLNKSADTQIATTGAGSPGQESSYFGAKTKAAVIKFQEKYAAEILTPVGLTKGTGTWGASTRAQANKLNATCGTAGGTTGTTTGGTTTTVGGALMVSAAAQPANGLAPESAARVPFTNFTLTNTSSAAVTVTGVTVEKTGFGDKAAFAGVVLVDETGMQLGSQKTFNTNNQTAAGDPFTINPGQTKTITVAGNMQSVLDSYTGQVVSLSVVGINTTATVSGSLPITGASHTLNSTLAVGGLQMDVGSSDPDTTSLNSTTAGKEIGTTGYTMAAVRMTNTGSAEDILVKSIRFNQTGSVGSTDLANVKAVVDGTEYPMTVSADGKYYSANFGNGIEIQKGLQKEVVVKIDIVGGSNRTVEFDLYKATDVYAVGKTYGYGITPSAGSTSSADDSSQFTTGTPFFSGTKAMINAGTVSSVSRASEVPAQNVVANTSNQPIGGFVVDIKGEAIQVQSMAFGLNFSAQDYSDITSVTLVDENGAVVAGPVDGTSGVGTDGQVAFTDTVTFPTGRHVYTLKGKLGTQFVNGDTVQATTTPATYWTNITGQTTGDSITLSNAQVEGNTMTVKTGAVALSIASSPAAKNVVPGVTANIVSAVQFDATQSGEDVKFSSAKFYYDEVSAMAVDPVNCYAYDGATRLNSTAVNPTTDNTDYTFSFDTNLVVPKGTVKTVSIKCDIPGSAQSGSFAFDVNYNSTAVATFTGTGVASSQTVTPTTPSAAIADGNTMTIASGGGTFTITSDASTPAYAIAAAGTSNVTLGVLRFDSTDQDMKIDRVALQMSNSSASSSPSDLKQVTLWDGTTQVGTVLFTGSNRYATSTLSQSVIVPANGYKTLTIKGDLEAVGAGQAGHQGALIQVDYDGADSTGTRAIGQSSGSVVAHSSTSDTSFAGVRVFKSFPTFARLSTPSTTLVAGTNTLYRFSVTANSSGGISLNGLTINVATSAATTTSLSVYAYTDSAFSSPVSGFSNGLLTGGVTNVGTENTYTLGTDELNIPAGTTYYFEVKGEVTVTATSGTSQVTTKIAGDAAFPAGASVTALMSTADVIEGAADNDFIWSPNATTTSQSTHADWTNGYGVLGLPSTYTDSVTLSKTN